MTTITKKIGDFTLNEIRRIHDSVEHCGKDCPFFNIEADIDEVGFHCLKNRPERYDDEIEISLLKK